LVTDRATAIDVLRDPDSFTVDDPRFSTARVLGVSMLSLDGTEHRRHRSPFVELFAQRGPTGARVRTGDTIVQEEAERIVGAVAPSGRAELRTEVVGPFAASVIGRVLGLATTTASGVVAAEDVLGWYRAIVNAVDDVDAGRPIADGATDAIGQLRQAIGAAASSPGCPLAAPNATLAPGELFSNVAVTLFGAIETVEGMTTNTLHHLLNHPDALAAVVADPQLLPAAIEESLRLEPAAALVDRYATRTVRLGGVTIPAGALVSVSIAGANRDPAAFRGPDRFDPGRANSHLSFATGPHACLGAHLARTEVAALLATLLRRCDDLAVDPVATDLPTGLIFRKPARLTATWTPKRIEGDDGAIVG